MEQTPRTHRFYVGSPACHPRGWAKKTYQEAIDHATEKCLQTGDEQFVVEVIAIVRPEQPPVVVERLPRKAGRSSI